MDQILVFDTDRAVFRQVKYRVGMLFRDVERGERSLSLEDAVDFLVSQVKLLTDFRYFSNSIVKEFVGSLVRFASRYLWYVSSNDQCVMFNKYLPIRVLAEIYDLSSSELSLYSEAGEVLIRKPSFFCRLPPEPDSKRADEILTTSISLWRAYVVNRDDAVKALMDIHLSMYLNRRREGTIKPKIVPVIEEHKGMGKTAFALRYLALIERWRFGSIQGASSYPEFQQELKEARSLHFEFFSYNPFRDPNDLVPEFINRLESVLEKNFGFTVSYNNEGLVVYMRRLVAICPIFLIMDGIHRVFENPTECEMSSEDQFAKFVEQICVPMLSIERLYFVVSGRGRFLARAACNSDPTSPVKCRKVHLNWLRHEDILSLMRNTRTMSTGGVLLSSLVDNDWEYAEDLLAATNGNPREIVGIFSKGESRFAARPDPLRYSEDNFKMFGEYIGPNIEHYRVLFRAAKSNADFDLTLTVPSIDGSEQGVTYEYFANFSAYYGPNVHCTKIVYPFAMWQVLTAFCATLEDYVEMLQTSGEKKVLDEIVLRWFQTVFSDKSRTCGTLAQGFIPTQSRLFDCVWKFDPLRRYNRPPHGDESRFFSDLASELQWNFRSGYHDVYFLEEHSPSILLLPEGRKLLVGVLVGSIAEDKIAMFRKIYEISGARRGVLIFCAISSRGVETRRSWIMEGVSDIEVIIMNLSDAEHRKAFFEVAMIPDKDDRIANMIEVIFERHLAYISVHFGTVSIRKTDSHEHSENNIKPFLPPGRYIGNKVAALFVLD